MDIAINILVALVAFLHLYFFWFEMFAWTTKGRKVFKKFLPELFEPTKLLVAANQRLYNGFLFAGLPCTFIIDNTHWKTNIALFFLGCRKEDFHYTSTARSIGDNSYFIMKV